MFSDAVKNYGESTKKKLNGPGQREALLVSPISQLIEETGKISGLEVVCHNEVTEQDGAVRPDFAVKVNGLLCGHIELKAPGTNLDPASYGSTTHNHRQWTRLRELPNLLHTNGTEFRLWRYGELVGNPIHVHAASLTKYAGPLQAPAGLESLILQFLQWSPTPITSVNRLVDILAPLARLLREEVHDAVRSERKLMKLGRTDIESLPFTGIARDWRSLLFPGATDAEFSDGFSQTVVFALLLALSENIDLSEGTIEDISNHLSENHTLMGRTLKLLTEHIAGTATWNAIETVIRVLSATDWSALGRRGDALYLHLYEDFLEKYDPEMRELSGSYYTPVPVVDGMVRLTDIVLRNYLNKPEGLRNPNVSIVDPAMGTGTFPLAILRKVGNDAAEKYGPGARPEAVNSAIARLYGIELQSGPFSVAELRMTAAITAAGSELPTGGLNFYVADTLEDPKSGTSSQLTHTASLIAKQRRQANRMKLEKNVQVCIGNPPYDDHAGGRGGWIENGIDPQTNKPPLSAFKIPGNGKHERHLSNMYAYFWRWATWKVFESTNDVGIANGGDGVITFITATGYLAGPGFRGMRKYLRETCSHGWIINMTPEGKMPPKRNAVFNIETPVAIAIFTRSEATDAATPASIKYIDIHGTREEKFERLLSLSMDDPQWREVRTSWTAPFSPVSQGDWDEYPATSDLFPFKANGIMAGRGWVYSPSSSALESRLREVINETDPSIKSELFKEGRDVNLKRGKHPLPGDDVTANSIVPFERVNPFEEIRFVRCGFRFLDNQYLIADSRLLSRPSPNLWKARIPSQVFAVELHSESPRRGPGLVYTGLIPDVHHFRGSGGGRTLPRLHPDGSPNIAPGLISALSFLLGRKIDPVEVFSYAAGVAGHSGFVETFEDELMTPGIRIPITRNVELWDRAVTYGNHIQWLHTFGQSGEHPLGFNDVRDPRIPILHPIYEAAVGSRIPSEWHYDPEQQTLHVGAGKWTNVPESVMTYEVGGNRVVKSWLNYRIESPKKKVTSNLDLVNSQHWEQEWSQELSQILSIIIQIRLLESDMNSLISEIVNGERISYSDLENLGVQWPKTDHDHKPRLPFTGLASPDEEI